MVYTGLYVSMELQREAPDPLYQQIIDDLTTAIEAGRLSRTNACPPNANCRSNTRSAA